MDEDATVELNQLFGSPNAALQEDILAELHSLLRLHSIPPQELYYKWESYSMKMGPDTELTLKTARHFKKDIQDALERKHWAKDHHGRFDRKIATPGRGVIGNNATGVFELWDDLASNLPMNGAKKKSSSGDVGQSAKKYVQSSPQASRLTDGAGTAPTVFANRPRAGQIMVTLNGQIPFFDSCELYPAKPRVNLKAHVELAKFGYKSMAMKLSEASEILDDRIDEFLQIVQEYHKLKDNDLGNPASQSANEVVCVGRIASDSSEGKLNAASLVLETSRRTGAGLRVPLQVDGLPGYDFFPGRIIAVRGSNPTGSSFMVTELLDIPLLGPACSTAAELDVANTRLGSTSDVDLGGAATAATPLCIMVACGPYTPGHIMDFQALRALLDMAAETPPDVLVLVGPFIDIEHPSVIHGDFDIPDSAISNRDNATLNDVFHYYVSEPINDLVSKRPGIAIIMQPSVRDAVAKHVSFPQYRFVRPALGLSQRVILLANPATISINEIVIGITSLDILNMLRHEECIGGSAKRLRPMERWGANITSQRTFCPVFPPTARETYPPINAVNTAWPGGDAGRGKRQLTAETDTDFRPVGVMLDTPYLKLADWLSVRPDVLITPSVLTPFAQVVHSVVMINPGVLSKVRGPGTFARMTVLPATITDEERARNETIQHKLYERSRVDIMHI